MSIVLESYKGISYICVCTNTTHWPMMQSCMVECSASSSNANGTTLYFAPRHLVIYVNMDLHMKRT